MNAWFLQAGAAQRSITPPMPIRLETAGWTNRAAGHNRALCIHDDLYAEVLAVVGTGPWAIVALGVGAIDLVITEAVGNRAGFGTGLAPESVLVCATHCHSAPVLSPIAIAYSKEQLKENAVDATGSVQHSRWVRNASANVVHSDCANAAWRQVVIEQAAQAISQQPLCRRR